VRERLGADISEDEMLATLSGLGFSPALKSGTIRADVPSWCATKVFAAW